jgi:deoxyribodipyrimidine photo-lyase
VQRLGQKSVNAAPGPIAPTLAAARARVAAVRPAAYARTRNALDGAITGLSPYITHGLVSLTEVLTSVTARHELDVQHKLVYELGWRAFFRHVWQHRGPVIRRSLHEGPLPDHAYASELPDDIRQAATGVHVVDMAVRELYATGTLHNHARMWLASYVVHLRKVHWRAGADWLYAHLLDGDLASNHLSWQWVAGTGSSKPFLFNADNVARYAPPEWHSPGSVVDTSYEALDRMARMPGQRWLGKPFAARDPSVSTREPALLTEPPLPLGTAAPDATAVEGREVWLVHPWSLGELPILPLGTVVIGLCLADFHRAWPWNPGRWQFVGQRMTAMTDMRWFGDVAAVGAALQGARRVRCIAEPHLAPWLPVLAECVAPPALFPPVDRPCASFSQWWNHASRGLDTAADLLAVNEVPAW